jgi:hypothetical protein
MEWSDHARAVIQRVHATLPETATLKERKAAIDAAYPFGPRRYWPYKAWCKARRKYLERYGLKPLHPPAPGLFDGWARDPATGRPVIP